LIVQFREVAAEPYQPPEGGQPTRIIEAYRIQEREKFPDEPYLELCRIDFDPAEKTIRDIGKSSKPGKNEIDLRFRQEVAQQAIPQVVRSSTSEKAPVQVKESPNQPQETIAIGYAVLGEAEKDLHFAGLQNLVNEVNHQTSFEISLVDNITLDKGIDQLAIIYLTGNSQFELGEKEQGALSEFLESGGVIFGEGCAEGQQGTSSKGSKEFGLAFNQLAGLLNCKLEVVQRSHPLLSACHVFAEVPPGIEPAMLLEGGQMVYSGSDYGCSWQGGLDDKPLSRDIIRCSFEIGTNIITYARMMKAAKR
ncbi:MAG: DUF4159 domain-containing protein, partial [Dehalococcoidales bacterium]